MLIIIIFFFLCLLHQKTDSIIPLPWTTILFQAFTISISCNQTSHSLSLYLQPRK